MKALVTGGNGFIGGAIARRLLARGDAVASFSRSGSPELAALGAEDRRGDLGDRAAVEAACEGADAVFHVAAKAGVWGSWRSFHEANVEGTRNVLAACRARRVRRLVYTSTPSVVFNRRPIRGGDETLPYGRRWLGAYAPTKAIAEREVLAANGVDLATVALRPHLVWGPGDPHLLPRVVERARHGRLRIVGDGTNRVDIAYIGNVAAAHLAALEAPSAGGRAYFIAQGEPVRLWPWLNGILEALDLPPVRRRVPLPVAYAVGAVCEGAWTIARKRSEPPMTRFVAFELAKDHFFDIGAARRDLGYVPEVSTDAGAERAVADLAARGFGRRGG